MITRNTKQFALVVALIMAFALAACDVGDLAIK